MAQKRNFRMPEALSGLAERLGLKNGDENSPEAVIEANRKMGNEIAFCLRAIDFDRCAYKGQTPEDSAENRLMRTFAREDPIAESIVRSIVFTEIFTGKENPCVETYVRHADFLGFQIPPDPGASPYSDAPD